MFESRPARTLSPGLREECENDSLYSDELKNIVIAHEINVIHKREEDVKKVIRTEYETTKGAVRIYSFFTEEGKLKYSHTIHLNNT